MTMPTTPRIPEDVGRVVTRYLELVDEALSGRIEGLFLVGSVALGDYRSGQSDVDFVALSDGPLSSEDMDRLEAMHERLLVDVGRPWFDGLYLTRTDLLHDPAEVQIAPHSHEGRFQRDRGFEANPVTWLTLREHPLGVRGRLPEVWRDPNTLRTWTLNNLNSYWAGLADQLEGATSRLTEEAMDQVIPWCVPGVVRLAYTLATGDVTSKSGACAYALTAYAERWHPIVREAEAIRNGMRGRQRPPQELVRDTVAFMRHVIQTENASQR